MGIEVFQKVNAIANNGNTPSIQSGTFAQRPAVGTQVNGSIYIAWDTQQIFAVVSGAYVSLGGGAGVTTLDNGLTLTGTDGQLGGPLTKNTVITNPAFTLTIDQLTLGLLNIIGNIVQSGAVIPAASFGNDIILNLFSQIYAAVDSTHYNSIQVLGGLDNMVFTIATGAGGFFAFVTDSGTALIAAVNYILVGNITPSANTVSPVNGDVWQASGGALAVKVGTRASKLILDNAGFTDLINANNGTRFFYLNGATITQYFQQFSGGRVQLQNGGTFTSIPSARLALNTTTEGFLKPRMTTAQMNSIATPADGLEVYNTDFEQGYYYNASIPAWQPDSALVLADTRNASNFGLTASLANVASYAVSAAGDQTFTVGVWVNLRTVVTDTLLIQVSFTDNSSIARTLSFFPQGATVALLSVAGYYAMPNMYMRAKAGTTITVSATVSGAGSILYEVGGIITKINGN